MKIVITSKNGIVKTTMSLSGPHDFSDLTNEELLALAFICWVENNTTPTSARLTSFMRQFIPAAKQDGRCLCDMIFHIKGRSRSLHQMMVLYREEMVGTLATSIPSRHLPVLESFRGLAIPSDCDC